MTAARKVLNGVTASTNITLSGAALEAHRLLRAKRNVILYGAPGTGKTYAALQVQNRWIGDHGVGSVHLITFHPSYAYEDFVQGWRPDPSGSGQFVLSDGVLLEAINNANSRAKLDPSSDVLLVIDEINRADVARTFGELITFLEWDKRGLAFSTAQDRTRNLHIPSNLYVLGTMNTADKSVSLLDAAMRRRFAFVNVPPDPAAFSTNGWVDAHHGVAMADVLRSINRRLGENSVEIDRQLGQALLAVQPGPGSDQAILDRLQYDVLPLVEDYLYGDVDRIRDVLPGFVAADGHHLPVSASDLPALLAGLLGTNTTSPQLAGVVAPGTAPDSIDTPLQIVDDEDDPDAP